MNVEPDPVPGKSGRIAFLLLISPVNSTDKFYSKYTLTPKMPQSLKLNIQKQEIISIFFEPLESYLQSKYIMRSQFSDLQSESQHYSRSEESYSQKSQSEQDNEDKGQNFTNYPISRLQAFRMFKKHIKYGQQRVFWPQDCPDIIEDSLDQMAQYGYNFYFYYLSKGFKKREGRSYMRRKVKAKFHCEICSKSFTSILGSFQISFRIDGPSFDIKMKKKIISQQIDQISYYVRLYKMKCQKCQNFCEGAIYESQLKAVAKSFCVILAEIMDDIPPPDHHDDRKKQNEEMHKHRAELCEACQKGVCFNRDKNAINAYQIKENTGHVSHSSEEESDPKEELKPKKVKVYKHQDYSNWQKNKEQEKAKNEVYPHRNPRNLEEKLSSKTNKKIISWGQFIQTNFAPMNQNNSNHHVTNKHNKEFSKEKGYYAESNDQDDDYYEEYSDYGSETSENNYKSYQKKNLPLTQSDFPSLPEKKPTSKTSNPVVYKFTQNKKTNTTEITLKQSSSKKIVPNQIIASSSNTSTQQLNRNDLAFRNQSKIQKVYSQVDNSKLYEINKNIISIKSQGFNHQQVINQIRKLKICQKWKRIRINVKKDALYEALVLTRFIYENFSFQLKQNYETQQDLCNTLILNEARSFLIERSTQKLHNTQSKEYQTLGPGLSDFLNQSTQKRKQINLNATQKLSNQKSLPANLTLPENEAKKQNKKGLSCQIY